MPASKLSLLVVTPEAIIVDEKGIEIVVVKTPVSSSEEDEGKFTETGIMSDHAPMLARLLVSDVRYKKDQKYYYVAVAGGFLQVKKNVITISSPGAEKIEAEAGIDPALVAKRRAEQWLYEERVGRVGFDERAAEAEIKKASVDLYRAKGR
ncbi:MAG: F0F1 ATP synthase subunit epsilon [bacterium]